MNITVFFHVKPFILVCGQQQFMGTTVITIERYKYALRLL
jgi:hypothetical protein